MAPDLPIDMLATGIRTPVGVKIFGPDLAILERIGRDVEASIAASGLKDLDLDLDFDARTLAGTATYTLQWKDEAATQLVLDTRDLAIEAVEAEAAGAWKPLEFALAEADPSLGSKLTIETPQRPAKVRVRYRTSPAASGLQWLDPAMTEGGQLPFMFSQSQQIHARSWVPLQDTPQVRFTYTAHVTSPEDVMVLMSADNDPQAEREDGCQRRQEREVAVGRRLDAQAAKRFQEMPGSAIKLNGPPTWRWPGWEMKKPWMR